MAELASQSSIGAAHAVLTFGVPPKHSAPLTRGSFFFRPSAETQRLPDIGIGEIGAGMRDSARKTRLSRSCI